MYRIIGIKAFMSCHAIKLISWLWTFYRKEHLQMAPYHLRFLGLMSFYLFLIQLNIPNPHESREVWIDSVVVLFPSLESEMWSGADSSKIMIPGRWWEMGKGMHTTNDICILINKWPFYMDETIKWKLDSH